MKRFFLTLLFFLISLQCLYPKIKDTKPKQNEAKFQFGLGTIISTNHLLGIIETAKLLYEQNTSDASIEYPGISDKERAAYSELPKDMRNAIVVYNIFANLEYGIQARILWNAFMMHTDLGFVPMESSYNGRFDMSLSVNAGVRLPFFIMPYITGGVNFTFSFYPEKISDMAEQKKIEAGYGVVENFVFRPGGNIVVGLDLKLRGFSVGAYYRYSIKDVQEFKDMYEGIQMDTTIGDALALIFGAQSRFGVAVNVYF